MLEGWLEHMPPSRCMRGQTSGQTGSYRQSLTLPLNLPYLSKYLMCTLIVVCFMSCQLVCKYIYIAYISKNKYNIEESYNTAHGSQLVGRGCAFATCAINSSLIQNAQLVVGTILSPVRCGEENKLTSRACVFVLGRGSKHRKLWTLQERRQALCC